MTAEEALVIDGVRYVLREAYGLEDEEWLDSATVIVGPGRAKVSQAKLWELRLKNCVVEPKDLDIKSLPRRAVERLKMLWLKMNELDIGFLLGPNSAETPSPS